MNVNNGQIIELPKEFFKDIPTFHEQVLINKNDITEKQKETKRVSLKDHKSKLGKKLTEERANRKLGRNDVCTCGSGKKNKHCCQRYKV